MKKLVVLILLILQAYACTVLSGSRTGTVSESDPDWLRKVYSGPPAGWPAPLVSAGVNWKELGPVPVSPLLEQMDSLRPMIDLGRTLFFDKRLSGSNQISCASCHIPELSWADGRKLSLGHDDQPNRRNAPTILNTWYYRELFWDGRSSSLEDQAFSPINSATEMHSDMPELMMKLRGLEEYRTLFRQAYGQPEITPETVTEALAVFQRTLVSNPAPFDDFLQGETGALSDSALLGLHIFRTKAGCLNCHHGPLFTDNTYHDNGIEQRSTDRGRYGFSKKPEDEYKFRTASLRDVTRTGPWMHDGRFSSLSEVLDHYISLSTDKAGTSRPIKTEPLLIDLRLEEADRSFLLAFLEAISAAPPLGVQ